MKKTFKIIGNIIPYLILLIAFILIISVASAARKGETPTIFGNAIFLVVSPSMEDTILAGDIIFVNTKADDFHVGDIISFYQPNEESIIITHRIIEINEVDGVKYYTTQGDNNQGSLDWEIDFTEDIIVGKYISKSTFIGKVYQAIFSGGINLIFLVIILVFITIGGMEVLSIVKAVSLEKQKKAIEEEKQLLVQEELERLREEQKEEEK